MQTQGKGGITVLEVSRSLCPCKIWEQLGKHYQQLCSGDLPTVEDLQAFKKSLFSKKFVIFSETSKKIFYSLVKKRLLFDNEPYNRKLIITSNELTEKFFLPTAEHMEESRLSDISDMDFVFLTLDSGIIRPSTPRVVSELIEYRVLYDLPLWISIINSRITLVPEYSSNIDEYEKCFFYYSTRKSKFLRVNNVNSEQNLNDKLSRG